MPTGMTMKDLLPGEKLPDAVWGLMILGTGIAVFGRDSRALVLIGAGLWGVGVLTQIGISLYSLKTHSSHEDTPPPSGSRLELLDAETQELIQHLRRVTVSDDWPAEVPSGEFRRSLRGSTWHYCWNCSTFPTEGQYETHYGRPSGMICNECRSRAKAGECTRTTGWAPPH